ncbi:hypothetical protein, partial [Bacillus timonensis]|uniref:hypothetical protein n=1 Tax=Bacillus timonensis TaxID=1033734 RepID=UPI0002884B75
TQKSLRRRKSGKVDAKNSVETQIRESRRINRWGDANMRKPTQKTLWRRKCGKIDAKIVGETQM